ncbi:MAG: hypothetical protein ACREEZ_09810, partial [Stellaceae bacterium]
MPAVTAAAVAVVVIVVARTRAGESAFVVPGPVRAAIVVVIAGPGARAAALLPAFPRRPRMTF